MRFVAMVVSKIISACALLLLALAVLPFVLVSVVVRQASRLAEWAELHSKFNGDEIAQAKAHWNLH